MSLTTEEYFVLREGATQEERWSWDEISERCRSGEFTADTQIYMPDENTWVRVGETDLGAQLGMLVAETSLHDDEDVFEEEEDEQTRAEREEMEETYAGALEALAVAPQSVDPWIDAGALAFDLGHVDKARAHFQGGLDQHPFHPRLAQEVKRRFSRAQWREFSMLERPEAPWDDLGDVISFPLQSGPAFVAAFAAVFAALLFVPFGAVFVSVLALLLCYRCMRAVARGREEPPSWRGLVHDPTRSLALPFAVIAGVFAQWLVVFWVFARAGILIEGKADVAVISYIASSPVLTVALTLCALAYLPAAIVVFESSLKGALAPLNPWRVVRAVIAMRGEYAMSLLLLFAIAVVIGVVGVATGRVPVLGQLATGVAASVAALASGFILGRLRSRVAHVLGL